MMLEILLQERRAREREKMMFRSFLGFLGFLFCARELGLIV